MLDKSLYVVGKSDMPLWLLHHVLSPFLWIGTIIDSFQGFFTAVIYIQFYLTFSIV
jgi:hypothetical protein